MTRTRTGNTTATPRRNAPNKKPARAPRKTVATAKKPAPTKPRSFLAELGVIGMESIEPVILAALISGEPLLLIGPHGTGKSYLLARTCEALALRWRHYNASLLNFDDLVGYPLPGDDGQLKYVQTPSSVWDAEAVFIDEISRCRPDIQNKLFPIIHERRVQGIELEHLIYRWSAMNPPQGDDDDPDNGYVGSEPLDLALADRFAFVVRMPDWAQFTTAEQQQLILVADTPPSPHAATRIRHLVETGTAMLPAVRQQLAPKLAEYVQAAAALLRSGGIELSARRAAILLRNIVAVHVARLQTEPGPDVAESALLALTHSVPDYATGTTVEPVKLVAAHREAWKVCGLEPDSPRRLLLLETDPLLRLVLAIRTAESIPKPEFSGIVTDALNQLPDGARHAALVKLFESNAAGRLVAAVADQWAEQYALAATPQEFTMAVHSKSSKHLAWQRITACLAGLEADDPGTPLATNLLAGLFATKILCPADVDQVIEAWKQARRKLGGDAP